MRKMWIVAAGLGALTLTGPGCSKRADEVKPAETAAPAETGAAKAADGDKQVVQGAPIVQKDIEELATKILKAYKDKDLNRLAELGPERAKEVLIFLEPRNPHYEELLGDNSWRMKAVKGWDGTFKKMRIGINVIKLYFTDQDENTAVVLELVEENGKWVFHDLVQEPRTTYVPGADGKLRPAPGPRPAADPMTPPPNPFPVHKGPAQGAAEPAAAPAAPAEPAAAPAEPAAAPVEPAAAPAEPAAAPTQP